MHDQRGNEPTKHYQTIGTKSCNSELGETRAGRNLLATTLQPALWYRQTTHTDPYLWRSGFPHELGRDAGERFVTSQPVSSRELISGRMARDVAKSFHV
uniref:Uncharacterized protein n=1 Tax=Arundo donax TaxID=35708 RepID=A0A0A9FQF0_ARUDO